jgi:hypothetical protein
MSRLRSPDSARAVAATPFPPKGVFGAPELPVSEGTELPLPISEYGGFNATLTVLISSAPNRNNEGQLRP